MFEQLPTPSLRRIALWRLAFVMSVVGVVAIGLVYPIPLYGRRWGAIFDLAHAPTFFILLLLIVGLPDPRAIQLPERFPTLLRMNLRRSLLVVAALFGLGLTGEFLQKFTNRSPSWADVAANATGLVAGICWIAGWTRAGLRRAVLLTAVPVMLLGVSANPLLEIHETILLDRDMPRLASFERSRELNGWAARDADVLRSKEWATDGTHSLHVKLHAGDYPGVAFISPQADWSSYSSLLIDFRNPGQRPLPLIVKIHDHDHECNNFDHRDRFHRDIVLPAGEDFTLRIDLDDVEAAPSTRTMNLADMSHVAVFTIDVREGDEFFIDNVRLQ